MQTCDTYDGNCENEQAEWKVIMNKAFRKNYKQRKMYLCGECLIVLLDGVRSGRGPFPSDVKKIIKIKITEVKE